MFDYLTMQVEASKITGFCVNEDKNKCVVLSRGNIDQSNINFENLSVKNVNTYSSNYSIGNIREDIKRKQNMLLYIIRYVIITRSSFQD